MKQFDVLEYSERNPDDYHVQIFNNESMKTEISDLLELQSAAIRTNSKRILPIIDQMIELRTMEKKMIHNATEEQRVRLAHALIELNGFMTPLTLQQ